MNPSPSTAGMARAVSDRQQSPAATLANQLEHRTGNLDALVQKLDQIHSRLHGPRPEPANGQIEKSPPPMGFFDAIERQVRLQENLLEHGHQRADQILEALSL